MFVYQRVTPSTSLHIKSPMVGLTHTSALRGCESCTQRSAWPNVDRLGFLTQLGFLGKLSVMCLTQCHKPPMTGNGKHTTYKNGDDWGIVYSCFKMF